MALLVVVVLSSVAFISLLGPAGAGGGTLVAIAGGGWLGGRHA